VPLWARLVAVLVAAVTVPVLALTVAGVVVSLASIQAGLHRTTSFDVGAAPRLEVDVRFGAVLIEPGRDGRVVVDDRREASGVTRAGAAAGLDQTSVAISRDGDLVTVIQDRQPIRPTAISRESTITVQVPVHTDLDVSAVGSLHVSGVDGTVRLRNSGSAELHDVVLRGASTLDVPVGLLVMTNVTIAGSTSVTKQLGGFRFEGSLAPGGSSLSVDGGANDVTIALPHPTDARAAVASQVGDLNADPVWHFTPEDSRAPRRWTADLGPDPKGTVTVTTSIGDIDFTVR